MYWRLRVHAIVVGLLVLWSAAVRPARRDGAAQTFAPAVTPSLDVHASPASTLAVTGFGGIADPSGTPDYAVAVSDTRVVLVKNSGVMLTDRAGSVLASAPLGTFLTPVRKGLSGERYGDPQVLFDAATGRFFVSNLYDVLDASCTGANCVAATLLAVSKTASPTTLGSDSWYFYYLDQTVERGLSATTTAAVWNDFDHTAIVGQTLVITTALVKMADNSIAGGRIRFLDAPSLAAGIAPATWIDLHESSNGWEPAKTRTDDGAVFVLQSGQCGVTIERIPLPVTGPGQKQSLNFDASCKPRLDAAQPGGSIAVGRAPSSGQSVYQNGSLWVVQTVGKDLGAGTIPVTAWAEIDVTRWPTVRVVQFGTIGTSSDTAYNAAIAVDPRGNVAIVFARSSASEFPSLYYTGRAVADQPGTMRPPVLLRAGTAGFAAQPGVASVYLDYCGAATDPGGALWLVGPAATGGNSTGEWVTRIEWPALPTMALDRSTLVFAVASSGGAAAAMSPPQTVRLSQGGTGPVGWSVTAPTWLTVTPASGVGSASLTVALNASASQLTASAQANLTVTFTGSDTALRSVAVMLNRLTGATAAPFGAFETPAANATGLQGSISVSGWALDDVGIDRVEIWRSVQPGEAGSPFTGGTGDPRNGKIFIANATFVAGARPDVDSAHPEVPLSYRAGWGYLLLTWGLPSQGNGTFILYAFAFDKEGKVTSLGFRTVGVNNAEANKPFGSIDTPGIGGTVSGIVANFGWGLTPKVNGASTCRIPSSGVQVSIDSGPLQPVVYGDNRTDIAGAFAGFSNSSAGGGHYILDTTQYTNGPHTIGWLITDDCNRADGVGSRFFNIQNSGVTSGASSRLKAETSSSADFRLKAEATEIGNGATDTAVLLARGFGELPEMLAANESGDYLVEVKQGERIELRLPRGYQGAYQLVSGGEPRALPVGSTWDAPDGIFYWQPAPGFLGPFRIVFSNGRERISVRVVVE